MPLGRLAHHALASEAGLLDGVAKARRRDELLLEDVAPARAAHERRRPVDQALQVTGGLGQLQDLSRSADVRPLRHLAVGAQVSDRGAVVDHVDLGRERVELRAGEAEVEGRRVS